MNTEERSWLAGILEGEGAFYLRKDKPSVLVIEVEMTDKDVIDRVAALFGTSAGSPRHRAGRQPTYRARIQGGRALLVVAKGVPIPR